jgi:hypothetical protein
MMLDGDVGALDLAQETEHLAMLGGLIEAMALDEQADPFGALTSSRAGFAPVDWALVMEEAMESLRRPCVEHPASPPLPLKESESP